MKIHILCILAISSAWISNSTAATINVQEPSLHMAQPGTSPQESPAQVRNKKNRAMAPIKSAVDLENYVKLTPASLSPLSRLSKTGLANFLGSLTFNAKGVTGYRYVDLEEELTPTEIYRVLALFGVQSHVKSMKKAKVKTDADKRLLEYTPSFIYDDYWDAEGPDPDHRHHFECVLPATCKRSAPHICDSTC